MRPRLAALGRKLTSALHLDHFLPSKPRQAARGQQPVRRSLSAGTTAGTYERKGTEVATRGSTSVSASPDAVTPMARFKFLLFIAIIVALIGVTIAIFPTFGRMLSDDNRDVLQEYISSAGPLGVFILFALEILQVVVAFIPGGAVEVVAGVLYGTIGGSLIVIAGSIVSAAAIFLLVRKLGAPFVQQFVSSKDMKFMHLLEDPRKLNTMVLVLYLVPGLPKDVFTYLVPLTEMPMRDFITLSTIGRIPAIVASAYMGSAALSGNVVGAVVVFAIILALAIVGLVFRDRAADVADALRDRISGFRR